MPRGRIVEKSTFTSSLIPNQASVNGARFDTHPLQWHNGIWATGWTEPLLMLKSAVRQCISGGAFGYRPLLWSGTEVHVEGKKGWLVGRH